METCIDTPTPASNPPTSPVQQLIRHGIPPASPPQPPPIIKFPLYTKLIAALGLVMCLFMVTVIFTVNQHMRQSILDEFLKRGLTVARNLAALNTAYITTYNYVKIEQNVEFIVKENDLLYATILFFDGEVAAYSGRPEFKTAILSGPLQQASFASEETKVQYDNFRGISFCEIAVPIFFDQEKWGTVRVGFPLDNMQAAIHNTRNVLLGIGSVALLAGCLAALFLARRITSPVGALVRSVEALSQGDYDSTIKVRSRDEIGYLAHRFGAMQATVKDNISLLRRTNADLSRSNTKLNHEIDERRKAENALLRRDAILTAVSFAAKQLLQQNDWQSSIPEILGRLGNAAGMQYLYLARCQGDPDHSSNHNGDQILFQWHQNPPESPTLASQHRTRTTGERIPLQVRGEVWGYLQYEIDSMLRIKGATATIRGAMRTVAGNLGAAMERREDLTSLETANRAKDDFLANMSHELRTPLNHVIGFTELVLNQQFGELNEIQAEYLGDVLGSSKHLLSLINDILDLSKIEAGKVKFDPETVDIHQILENSLLMFQEKSLKHQLTLGLKCEELPPQISADGRLLKQVIYNLLGNAVKFTPQGGQITLEARQEKCLSRPGTGDGAPRRCYLMDHLPTGLNDSGFQEDICLHVAIKDTGIGIAPENLDHVFNRFDQVDSTINRKFAGTGLGLALAKSFVELHGGQIWAASPGDGRGSTFHFIIPMELGDLSATTGEGSREAPPVSETVLK